MMMIQMMAGREGGLLRVRNVNDYGCVAVASLADERWTYLLDVSDVSVTSRFPESEQDEKGEGEGMERAKGGFFSFLFFFTFNWVVESRQGKAIIL